MRLIALGFGLSLLAGTAYGQDCDLDAGGPDAPRDHSGPVVGDRWERL